MADPSSNLGFEDLGPVPGLPLNYLPAGLRAARLERRATAMTLVDIAAGPGDTLFGVVGIEALANPRSFLDLAIADGAEASRAPEANEAATDAPRLRLLGLPARRGARRVQAARFPPADLDPEDVAGDAPALVVIDHGIAFWNRRFRDDAGWPLFKTIQVLDLDALDPATGLPLGNLGEARLDRTEIEALCGTADGPGGQAAVRRKLGGRFPGGFFGGWVDADDLWHGTAMTDIALGQAWGEDARAGGAAPPLLFGVELPSELVEDRGGDALTAMLPTAIDAALGLTAALGERLVVILLAFGFTGGPQDGTHPAAARIAARLQAARDAGRRVELAVPAGNQRQDRAAAVLAPGAGPSGVGWRLPHDDFSPNTLEVCLAAADAGATLTLTAPDGHPATSPALVPHLLAPLMREGVLIGGLHAVPVGAGTLRVRVALVATAWRAGGLPGGAPAPAGLWRIAFGAAGEVRLWTLRDDPMASDRAAPHRQSALHDGRWRDRDGNGDWRLGDEPGAVVRRAGTASVLASAGAVTSVGASERRREVARAPHRDAAYSGLGLPISRGGTPIDLEEVVEWPAAGGALPALGNGGRRLYRVSGTSAAAARAAGAAARAP